MTSRWILVVALAGLLVMASIDCQPNAYVVTVEKISQPDGIVKEVSGNIRKYTTFSGAPLVIDFLASGFKCPNQDISFMVTYLYRRVRPTNFLEDPSLYVMEGYMTSTVIISEDCSATWTGPQMRDGLHTIGILAFDGAGAQSSWTYISVIKNNERGGTASTFPGGNQELLELAEEPTISTDPVVIIDTPSQSFKIGQDPVQYVDIHFHTNYPFLVEYFYVRWTFRSQTNCIFSSEAVVYPTESNKGFYKLDMSSVFASEWDEPSESYGKCTFGGGEFVIEIFCKTAQGLKGPSIISITLL
jgi:hypothetical protein